MPITVESPSPVPEMSPTLPPRLNLSKMAGCDARGIPIPLSETDIIIVGSVCSAEIFIAPPLFVNFIAFDIRFLSTVFSMSISAKTVITSGKELFIVHNEKEVLDVYGRLLLNPALCIETGRLARERVLKEHTYRDRARKLLTIVKGGIGKV